MSYNIHYIITKIKNVYFDIDGQWILRGAVSWGDPKCRAGTTYSVFARISSFVDWIKTHIKANPAPGLAQPNVGMLFTAIYHVLFSIF